MAFTWNKFKTGRFITGYAYKLFSGSSYVKLGNVEGVDNVVVSLADLPNSSVLLHKYALSVAFMNRGGVGEFSPKVFANYNSTGSIGKQSYTKIQTKIHILLHI